MTAVPGIAAAPLGVMELVFVDTATSANDSITIPAGAQAGDLAVLVDSGRDAFNPVTSVTPVGFTKLHEDVGAFNSGEGRLIVSQKIIEAGDSGTSITGMGGSSNSKIMAVVRPSVSIGTVTAANLSSEITENDPTAQTVSAGVAPLIVLGVGISTGGTPAFTTETPAMNNVTMSTARLGYLIYNSSPSSQQIDIADGGSLNMLFSGNIQVT